MRIKRFQALLKEAGLDGFALVPGTSLTYLTGIRAHVNERPFVTFLFADAPTAVVVPLLEAEKAENAGVSAERIFTWRDETGYAHAFQKAAATLALNGKKIGVEAIKMRVLEWEALHQAAPDIQLISADDLTAQLRMSKNSDEIEAMQTAAVLAEKAMTDVLPRIKIGMTEKEIATMIVAAILNSGANGLTFRPIVAAGPKNSASPHGVPTDRPIASGDLLTLDWGAQFGDYVSDITRAYAIGSVSAELKRIYHTVKRANEAGIAACTPGVTGAEIDAAARSVIEAAGYGQYFIHRTGHGLGMEAHEAPSLMAGNDTPLPVGAAFTVEPGIYIPGVGGVRIEDDIILADPATNGGQGCLVLTTLSKELIEIG